MPNPYFKFKQFNVFHDKCAMKVGADGVTLGAWADVCGAVKILDIGTGTGLIALMLAQRSVAEITAVDVESDCVLQAKENIEKSPFCDKINVLKSSIQNFSKISVEKFDLIVCNPPYFVNSLKSPSDARTTARHNDSLPFEELVQSVHKLLTENGRFCAILPVVEGNFFIDLSEKEGLYCSKKTTVFPNPEKPAKRLLLEFRKEKCILEESNLTIEAERHVYTTQYSELVKDFYLKL